MARMIKDIKFVIGDIESKQFSIKIAGRNLKIDDVEVKQEQASPTSVTFTLRDNATSTAESTEAILKAITGKRIVFWYRTHKPSGENNYDDDDPITFDGFITGAQSDRSKDSSTIFVDASSWSALMINFDSKGCKSYTDMTLKEIVKDVVDEYGIAATIEPKYQEVIPYCVRYNETAYEFLKRLSARYGEWIYDSWGAFFFGDMIQCGTDKVRDLVFPSDDVYDFGIETHLCSTPSSFVASSYNSNDMKVKQANYDAAMQGQSDTLASVVYNSSKALFKAQPLLNLHEGGGADSDSKDSVLDTTINTIEKADLSHMVRYCVCTYENRITIGSRIRVNEKRTVKKNKVDNQTEVIVIDYCKLTINANKEVHMEAWGMAESTMASYNISFHTYPECPPCRAKVIENEDSKEGMGRVKVQFDWQAALDPTMTTPWIRIATPYAGGGKGFNFIPEIGEEVMVDFESGNGERPYVVGMMVNGKNKIDEQWSQNHNERNRVKAIRTRNGHTIEFHDEDSGGGFIRIYDNGKENYVLTFDTDTSKITIESKGDIELAAQNDLILRAGHDIKMSADNEISTDAGKSIYTTAGEDLKESVKRDRALSVGHNDEVEVKQNQTVKVDNNYELEAKNKLQQKAASVRIEADQDIKETSTSHSIDTKSSYGVSSNGSVDIKGNITKIN